MAYSAYRVYGLPSFRWQPVNPGICWREYDKAVLSMPAPAGGFLDNMVIRFCRGRIFGMVERDNGQYDYQQEILWATGACMMIRSADYWKAGGLDGRFFAHNEEIDLCWRLRLMGRKIYCIPESEVYHVGGELA